MVFFIKQHTTYLIYSLLFLFLLFGVWSTSAGTYFPYLFLFFASFSISYVIINKLKSKISLPKSDKFNYIQNSISGQHLFYLSITLIIIHFIQLKGVPAIEALSLEDGDAIALVRANIADRNGTLFNYISSFLIHSILPFSILILFFEKKHLLYIILLCVASFYGFALMQKSYILTIFLPIIVYSIINKNFINLLLSLSIVVSIIISLTSIANPQLNNPLPKKENIAHHKTEVPPKSLETRGKFTKIFIGLKNRVIITPGKMVSTWFENIPKNLPHQGINGYGFISKLRNIEHEDYGKEMYLLIKKDKAELKGTMNAASFMYEYAYFGKYGLILTGIMLAILFNLIEVLFKDNFELKIALNLYSILILSSSSITTLIFSGGWGLIIFLSLLFPLKTKQQVNTAL